MIQIQQLKLPVEHSEADLRQAVQSVLRIPADTTCSYRIVKKSIDARKKKKIQFVYTLHIDVPNEKKVLKKCKAPTVSSVRVKSYQFPGPGTSDLLKRPVIVGSGPAGLFCGLMLARHGYRPILLERGADVEERLQDVESFWETGVLKPGSNVQFGEGGAGTFSDGKLNTLVKDASGRNRTVLETLIQFGAPEEILYWNKPHIGTDLLRQIVKNIREEIIALGGEVRFHSQVTDIKTADGNVVSCTVNGDEEIPVQVLVLAVGHSARDTFAMLYQRGLEMGAKSFAVGVRIEHPQKEINIGRYGVASHPKLPPAEYKLTKKLENGRGVYTFCMCPGGYVVNASSEEGMTAVNGMSYHKRDGENANSAVIVTVNPADFPQPDHPLGGVAFQQELERRAFEIGGGRIPVETLADFRDGTSKDSFGKVRPAMKGAYQYANVREIFPSFVTESLIEGVEAFDSMLPGFGDGGALVSGPETRTSSPVRIFRNETHQSNIAGLYPCGEGAGYAGGITSAAMDGIRIAETIAAKFRPF